MTNDGVLIFIVMEEINGYIYLLIDKRNGKKYVGKHIGNDTNYFTGGTIPKKIIKKYGKDIFDRLILEESINNPTLLNEKEIYYIKLHNTFKDGYNLTEGGDGGGSWLKTKTNEEKIRISLIKKEKNIGRTFSEETLKKMSEAKKGKPLSENHKKKIKESQSGENHPWYGKKHKEETKKKISESRKGKKNHTHSEYMKKNNPMNLEITIEDRIFESIQQASEILNIPRHIVKTRLNSEKFPNWVKNKK